MTALTKGVNTGGWGLQPPDFVMGSP